MVELDETQVFPSYSARGSSDSEDLPSDAAKEDDSLEKEIGKLT